MKTLIRTCLPEWNLSTYKQWNSLFVGRLPRIHISVGLLFEAIHFLLGAQLLKNLPARLGSIQSVQLLSCVWLFATPWITARQASLSITNSRSLPKPMSIESVMPSNHLILCHPLVFLPPIPPSIRVFSNESALRIRRPKYWEFQLQHQSFQWTPRPDL